METIKPIILLLVAGISAVFIGCTHNDGDIGDYFGTWKLEEISVDGIEDAGYGKDIFWQFQSTVFCMRKVYENHGQENRWGTWYQDSGSLYVDFSHREDGEDETGKYSPFPVTRLAAGLNRLEIMHLSKRSMRLEFVDADGTVYRYELKKWK